MTSKRDRDAARRLGSASSCFSEDLRRVPGAGFGGFHAGGFDAVHVGGYRGGGRMDRG
jgi:hypothetical protein